MENQEFAYASVSEHCQQERKTLLTVFSDTLKLPDSEIMPTKKLQFHNNYNHLLEYFKKITSMCSNMVQSTKFYYFLE